MWHGLEHDFEEEAGKRYNNFLIKEVTL